MTGQRTSSASVARGATIATVLSAAFLALVVFTSPLVAVLVAVPVSIAVGAARAHAVPRRPAHCLLDPSYAPVAVVAAPRVTAATPVDRSGSSAA